MPHTKNWVEHDSHLLPDDFFEGGKSTKQHWEKWPGKVIAYFLIYAVIIVIVTVVELGIVYYAGLSTAIKMASRLDLKLVS